MPPEAQALSTHLRAAPLTLRGGSPHILHEQYTPPFEWRAQFLLCVYEMSIS